MSTVRIPPIEPPYDDETQQLFDRIMPPGMAPLNIFRTYARHPKLFKNVMARGGMLLYEGELSHRDREIVLHRTCARCGSEYEWGVHVTAFARPLGFTDEEIQATAVGDANDPVWSERDALLIRAADELHETSTISDALWTELATHWNTPQLLEIIAVAGFYHAVSYMTNACRIDLEATGERFPQPV